MINRIKEFAGVLRLSRHPLKIIFGQLLAKTGLHRFFTIPMQGYKINFSRSALALSLFADSHQRHEDEQFLQRILKPGQVYADIGANIGTLILSAAAAVGPTGKVIGIEAHPVTFKHLQANVAINDFSNIVLINSAAGDKEGSVFFSNINSDDQNKVLTGPGIGIEIKVDTPDHLLAAESTIDVLKIDVEGYEKFVLQGATLTLQKTRIVYFESWEKHFSNFGYKTADIIRILKENNFEVYKPTGNQLVSLPASYQSERCENLVALKDTNGFCKAYGYVVTG